MTKYIAVTGKGGTGKTAFTALLLKQLVQQNNDISILTVDADPNANLNEALGLAVPSTISDLVKIIKDPQAVPPGIPKDVFLQNKLLQSLITAKDFDFLVMGNPQEPGCYCYPHDLLRRFLNTQTDNYTYVLVDTEAGLEHLSRKTIPWIDLMVIISDPTLRGLHSAAKINQLISDLQLTVKDVHLVVSKTTENTFQFLNDEIIKTGIPSIDEVPYDSLLAEFDLTGKPIYELPDHAVSVQAIQKILRKIDLIPKNP